MSSTNRRFQNLWASRSTKASASRRRRTNRANFSTFGGAEFLEQRALLAGVTATYVDDFVGNNVDGGAGAVHTYTNTDKGVLVLTIDGAGTGGDDIFMRVVGNNYFFATDVSFSSPIQISVGASTLSSMASGFTNDYTLITKDSSFSAGPPAVFTPATTDTFTSAFDTIYVKTSGLTDGVDSPSFTIIGSSQDVTKSLVVDLTSNTGAALSNSFISIGGPVKVSAASAGGTIGNQGAAKSSPETVGGAIYLGAESVAINAAVTSQNDLTLASAVGADNLASAVVPAGIAINQVVTVPGGVGVTVSGTALNVNAGGSIGNGAGASTTFTLNLQDADARIAGKISATDQSYFLQETAGDPLDATAHTITTRSASTGVQAGTISGGQVLIYLANKAAAGADGSVDLQTSVDNLRITSSASDLASTLDYAITVTNSKALLVDSVAASKGDISLATTAGTVTLQAAIDTLGSFSLSSGADLTVDSSITSAANVLLTSTAGSVTTNAAIKTNEAVTNLGQIVVTAKNDVTINSLVQAEHDGVSVTATTGKISSGANLALEPTSRITGSSATLKAATGISLGTSVDAVIASITGTGDLSLDDNGSGAAQFVLSSVTTNAGSVSVKAARDIGVTRVVAGGAGDVTITSTGGDIDLSAVTADGNAVTLNAVNYDTDGVTVLSYGVISGSAPTANEISWTAGKVVDAADPTQESTDLYRNIAVISANRLSAGDVDFTADRGVTLKSIVTTDGAVKVVSTAGSITATSINAQSVAASAGVSLDAQGGGVTLGSIAAAANGKVVVAAAQGIADDGNAGTTAITANDITLRAATSGVSADIGSSVGYITVAGVAAGDSIDLLIAADTDTYTSGIEAANVYVSSASDLNINGASAVNSVDILTSGPAGDIFVGAVAVSDSGGQVKLASTQGDLTVGDVQVAAGAFGELSQISLSAGKSIVNASADPADTILEAYKLVLSAQSFDGTFDVSNVDNVVRLAATATGAKGVVNLVFNRAAALTLDGISTTDGNVTVTNKDAGDLLIGVGGITAGSGSTSNTVTLSTLGAIGEPTDITEAEGTIFSNSLVSLTADGDITVVTKAAQLAGSSTNGSIDITQTGNVKIAAAGLSATTAAASVSLAVTGDILSGPGSIVSDTATVSATGNLDIRTDVDTLSAKSTGGNVTVLEADGLTVSPLGISSAAGAVSLTLTKGALDGAGQVIKGSSVAIKLLETGNAIDVDTSTSTLTASTVDGDITIRNDKSVGVGAAGIVVGNLADNNVTIEVAAGSITATAGSFQAKNLSLSATTGINAKTSVSQIDATSTAGDISFTQTGKAVTLDAILASNGSVTVTNNNDVTVTSVQAIGSGKNVSITATGTNKSITIGANSIVADGDKVTLASTGGIDGTPIGTDPDITAGTISLSSTNGDVTATVKATTVTASALGTDAGGTSAKSDVDLTILGTKSLFLGTSTGVNLSAAGDVTLHADPNNIIVVKAPTAGGTTTFDTSGVVTFAVSTAAATGSGSLTQALADAGAATITGGGTAGVAFTTNVGSPIQLTSTIDVIEKITLDGTLRINTTTGALSTGRQVDIDGSRLVSGTSGFKFGVDADDSTVRGFAFYGFNKANGAGVELASGADGVTIANNLFGISSTGRVSSNTFGILAAADDAVITGNTVVKSTSVGIEVTGSNATVTGNLIGTNTTRTSLGNATGIRLNAAGAGTEIGGSVAGSANVVAFNSVAGIHVSGTDASAGDATSIRGNEVLLNGAGILINGATKSATVAGNTVTRNTLDGITVNGTSEDVTVGGASASDRNYIGTTSTNALGLGNRRNGIHVSSTGANVLVQGNTVLGNGVGNSASNNAGVKLSGVNNNALSVTGNVISGNRGAGVLSSGTGTGVFSVAKNTITSNSGSGVQVASGTVVVGGANSDTDNTLRTNANTINSNAGYGVQVLAGAFAQIAGNSMASNRLGGILNPGLSAPTITSVTRKASNSLLTVNFSSSTLSNGQVVHVYAGTAQGRTYLGSFVYGTVSEFSTNGTSFTMNITQQQAAGVQASIFAGAQITGTRTSTGAGTEQTSAFAAVKTVTRVA
jgi:hypothetical protein